MTVASGKARLAPGPKDSRVSALRHGPQATEIMAPISASGSIVGQESSFTLPAVQCVMTSKNRAASRQFQFSFHIQILHQNMYDI